MKRKALKAAFPYTIPIMTGFWFLGLAYGIYAKTSGFAFVYPLAMSILIFGGSLEFLCVEMLLSPFNPIQTFLMAFVVQARHLFYGLSMLDKYKGTGWKKPYLIFGMCDESFSVNCSVDVPHDVDKGWFYFFVTILNQSYWVTGATLGGLIGSFITVEIKGIDFVMTAMFVVIFLEQWLKEKNHFTSLIGLVVPTLSLIILGADYFVIPAMAAIMIILIFARKPLERSEAKS